MSFSRREYTMALSIRELIESFIKRAGENGDLGFETVTEDFPIVIRDLFDNTAGRSVKVIQSDAARWRSKPLSIIPH